MRVLVIGAAGRSGREISARLGRMRGIDHLYLADRDAEALCRIASDLVAVPASPRYLDLEDEGCLLERVSEADLVVACAGPSHQYEERMAGAALAAGRDYITLCDDPEAAAALMRLRPEAEARGVRMLCGMGLTPGISNLLACRAAAWLEDVRSVAIAWCLRLSSGLGPATLAHLLRACGGDAPSWRAGRVGRERSGGWPRTAQFPPPLGWRQVYYLAHPEPLSLPEALPGLARVDFAAGFGETGLDLAMLTLAWIYEGAGDSWTRREAVRIAASSLARRLKGGPLAAVMVRAEGMVNGAPSARILATAGDYYGLTAAMVVAAIENLLADETRPGLFFPEQALDNPSFFSRLEGRGVRFLVGEERGRYLSEGEARRTRATSGWACLWKGKRGEAGNI